jgi:predicted dehydrogenase
MDAVRVAVVGRTGGGDYGHAIDQLFADLPGVRLVAVADESAKGLAAAAARNGLEATHPGVAFTDWRQMLADVKPDVLGICMRHVDCHAEMALAAAEAGVGGIFLEKPFVRTVAEADAVVEACRKSGTKLSLALVNRHCPTFPAVRDMIESGRIGRVLEFRARGKEDHRGGGEDLAVLGIHVLDLMTNLGGEPRWCQASVTVQGRTITAADAVEGPEGLGRIAGDAIQATFGFPDGTTGFFTSIRDAGQKQPNFGLTIVGTQGTIHIRPDHLPQAYFRAAPPWRVDREVPWKPIGPQGFEAASASAIDRSAERSRWGKLAVLDLLDAIREDREPETGMFTGRLITEMNAAIYASAMTGRKISWPLERSATFADPLSSS